MGSAENGGGQHLAPEGRQIGTPPTWDVYDTFPYCHAEIGLVSRVPERLELRIAKEFWLSLVRASALMHDVYTKAANQRLRLQCMAEISPQKFYLSSLFVQFGMRF